jgi:hypothetical protein
MGMGRTRGWVHTLAFRARPHAHVCDHQQQPANAKRYDNRHEHGEIVPLGPGEGPGRKVRQTRFSCGRPGFCI